MREKNEEKFVMYNWHSPLAISDKDDITAVDAIKSQIHIRNTEQRRV